MNAKIRYGLSAAVLALIAAGAPAPDILDQFLDEKEGNHTTAYRDGAGIWTICRGATRIEFIRSEPHHLFDEQVVKAMAKWRFEKDRPCKGVKKTFIFSPSAP